MFSPKKNIPMSRKEIDKKQTEQEKFENEIAAINLLQQIGVSFHIPLKKEEIRRYKTRNIFFNKYILKDKTKDIPRDFEIKTQKIPNPNNPTEEIEYFEVEINIRPLYLETIDTIRKKRLEIEIKDPLFKECLEKEGKDKAYLLKYTKEICEVLAIATINSADERKNRSKIKEIAKFYNSHLTNQRLLKLTSIVMMMMDIESFHVSTRLIMGIGTTAPHEANRVEKVKSKA